MIAHYFVNFEWIQAPFKFSVLYLLNSACKKYFKAIASVVVLVAMTKNCKWFLAIFACF